MSFVGIPSQGSRFWRDAADTVGDLPASAANGEVRYVKSEDSLYAFNGTSWAIVSNGLGTIATSNLTISEDPPSGPGNEGDIWIQV